MKNIFLVLLIFATTTGYSQFLNYWDCQGNVKISLYILDSNYVLQEINIIQGEDTGFYVETEVIYNDENGMHNDIVIKTESTYILINSMSDSIVISRISDSLYVVENSSNEKLIKGSLLFPSKLILKGKTVIYPKWISGKRDGVWTFLNSSQNTITKILYKNGYVTDTISIKDMGPILY